MNVKFLHPFAAAAHEVLLAETGLTVTRGSVSLHKSALTTDDITVLISLVGDAQGVVLYSCSSATGLALVSRIMGPTFTELDALAQSGLAELGNVITGRATIKLAETGCATSISPPALIVGKGASISTLDFSRLVIPLQCSAGEIAIHLALRENLPPGGSLRLAPVEKG